MNYFVQQPHYQKVTIMNLVVLLQLKSLGAAVIVQLNHILCINPIKFENQFQYYES